jgi:hypothetical protein
MCRCNLLLCFFVLAGASRAQSPSAAPLPAGCPWLTQGSAAKALGGAVSATAHLSDAGEGWCNFSRREKPDAFLKVEVSKTALPSCGADSAKLRGVGNEAMRCLIPGSGDQRGEMISGRVRDLHFVITLEAGAKKTPTDAAGAQEDVLQQVAEQVAGNLF